MKTAVEMYKYYTERISNASTGEQKKRMADEWYEVYNNFTPLQKIEVMPLFEASKAEFRKMSEELDKRIIAAGFSSFEDSMLVSQ